MLVLTRKVGESIKIGDEITITVLEARGDVVRIGIDAPRSVKVHREEVYREIASANEDAASPSQDAVAALAAGLTSRKPAAGTANPLGLGRPNDKR